MDIREYIETVKSTANTNLDRRETKLNWTIGLGGEVGELQNIIKKYLYHNAKRTETKEAILDEAGDVLWYLTMLLDSFDYTLLEAMAFNAKKLKKRYPDGFETEEFDDE